MFAKSPSAAMRVMWLFYSVSDYGVWALALKVSLRRCPRTILMIRRLSGLAKNWIESNAALLHAHDTHFWRTTESTPGYTASST